MIDLDWMDPNDDYSIRNLTVEAEADWRFCFPTLNMHHQRSKVNGAKDSFLYYFDVSSELLGGMQGANHCSGKFKPHMQCNMFLITFSIASESVKIISTNSDGLF